MMPINLMTTRPITLKVLDWYALNMLAFYIIYLKVRRTKGIYECEKTSLTWIRMGDLVDSSRRV